LLHDEALTQQLLRGDQLRAGTEEGALEFDDSLVIAAESGIIPRFGTAAHRHLVQRSFDEFAVYPDEWTEQSTSDGEQQPGPLTNRA
jgi:hypothetical protein